MGRCGKDLANNRFPMARGCESILKAYKNLYLKIFNLLIFMIYTEYKPRFVLQILNTFTVSLGWAPTPMLLT